MSDRRSVRLSGLWMVGLLVACVAAHGGERKPDVHYVPTSPEVVAEMLKMAGVGTHDVVYDLGCGDGRIVITAVEKFGARKGVGIDIDPQRIKESIENARRATVGERVTFLRQDLFDTDFSDATVVSLYLLPELNLRLRPALFRQLRPGDRIVSHDFDMDEWEPDKTVEVPGSNGDGGGTAYYWMLPGTAAGTWQWKLPGAEGEQAYRLRLRQRFQTVTGTLEIDGKEQPVSDAKLLGDRLTFDLVREAKEEKARMTFAGRIVGNALRGRVESKNWPPVGKRDWTAERDPVNLVGAWRWTVDETPATLRIQSRDGRRYAGLTVGQQRISVPQFYVWGSGVYFLVDRDGRKTYEGVVEGDRIVGTVGGDGEAGQAWTAEREAKAAGKGSGRTKREKA